MDPAESVASYFPALYFEQFVPGLPSADARPTQKGSPIFLLTQPTKARVPRMVFAHKKLLSVQNWGVVRLTEVCPLDIESAEVRSKRRRKLRMCHTVELRIGEVSDLSLHPLQLDDCGVLDGPDKDLSTSFVDSEYRRKSTEHGDVDIERVGKNLSDRARLDRSVEFLLASGGEEQAVGLEERGTVRTKKEPNITLKIVGQLAHLRPLRKSSEGEVDE
jgi:hypothetical protein